MQTTSRTAEQFEKIRTIVYPTAQEACVQLAGEVRKLIEEKARAGKKAVLGLATGSTPVPFYRELIRLHREEGLSFKNVITFNLDEYYGLGRDHRESYFRFMQEQLFAHIDVDAANVHVPDGLAPMERVFEDCERYEAAIDAAGGIDLQILGIGRTGHIGFNEPGSSRYSRTRLISMDRVTRADAASDFLGEENVPRFAITMGVGTILRARQIVLMAWGANKAEIVREAVEGLESEAVSASFLQSHPNARFLVNHSAASALTRIRLPWLVGQAKWTDPETRRAVCWLSKKEGKAILKLGDEEYNENGMADLVTKAEGAYNLNVRMFNRQQHTISGWPGGKPDADDANRPERKLPFPKKVLVIAPEPEDEIMSMGGTIDRLVSQGHEVTMVCQASGDLRVADSDAMRFANVLLETAREAGWDGQIKYAEGILKDIQDKGAFGDPRPDLRRLKGFIRRGEARDAAATLGVRPERMRFLDLPFYAKGRYRQFVLTDEDVGLVKQLLEEVQPHQIYATGNLADPSSVQGLGWRALRTAMESSRSEPWFKECRVWLYRAHQNELEPHEIDMAVPLSPDQLAKKVKAVQKFQSHNLPDKITGQQNQGLAKMYDALGMAEYEAIEAFQRWLE